MATVTWERNRLTVGHALPRRGAELSASDPSLCMTLPRAATQSPARQNVELASMLQSSDNGVCTRYTRSIQVLGLSIANVCRAAYGAIRMPPRNAYMSCHSACMTADAPEKLSIRRMFECGKNFDQKCILGSASPLTVGAKSWSCFEAWECE